MQPCQNLQVGETLEPEVSWIQSHLIFLELNQPHPDLSTQQDRTLIILLLLDKNLKLSIICISCYDPLPIDNSCNGLMLNVQWRKMLRYALRYFIKWRPNFPLLLALNGTDRVDSTTLYISLPNSRVVHESIPLKLERSRRTRKVILPHSNSTTGHLQSRSMSWTGLPGKSEVMKIQQVNQLFDNSSPDRRAVEIIHKCSIHAPCKEITR